MAEKTEEGLPRARLLLPLLRFIVVRSSSSKEICRKFKDLDNIDLNGRELSRSDFVDSESKGPPKSILSNDFDKTALIILCSSSRKKNNTKRNFFTNYPRAIPNNWIIIIMRIESVGFQRAQVQSHPGTVCPFIPTHPFLSILPTVHTLSPIFLL